MSNISKKSSSALQLKITLKDSKPAIWRRLLVPQDFTFHDLHLTIQTAFDWMNYHLYAFESFNGNFLDNESIVDLSVEENKEIGEVNSRKEKIKNYFQNEKDKMIYVYDFGDDWKHEIVLEKIVKDYEFNYPKCLKAVMCAPCEDSGGIWGWEEIMDIIKNYDPENEEHIETFEWLQEMMITIEDLESPSEFDPNKVDLVFINKCLEEIKNCE